MDIGYITDKGIKRENNEDAFFADNGKLVFIVADGVGGHNAGEVASSIAVTEISSYIMSKEKALKKKKTDIFSIIAEGLSRANLKIIKEASENESCSDMATTAVVAVIPDDVAYISNVGDSRAYLMRDGEIIRLTEDHTVANRLMREADMTEEQIEEFGNNANINPFSTITRALGSKENAEADNYSIMMKENDMFLLCSDGLYEEVTEEKMLEISEGSSNAQAACEKLAEEANRNGGHDNITAILIKIGADDHE